ncbi:hypothetical protein J2Z42_001203 [Clostridium algifaecis]|uniref:Uncharacterized protein n=1 Tax=Clostridium algifaecis TaxID=1472040 RepID=A0ABS4KST3_9CLOT|nr:hypothetical protein [Clostridium algifaecis]
MNYSVCGETEILFKISVLSFFMLYLKYELNINYISMLVNITNFMQKYKYGYQMVMGVKLCFLI